MVLASLAPLPPGMLLLQRRCQQVGVCPLVMGIFCHSPSVPGTTVKLCPKFCPGALSLNQSVYLPTCLP